MSSSKNEDSHSGIICQELCDVHDVSSKSDKDPLMIFDLCCHCENRDSRLSLSVTTTESRQQTLILITEFAVRQGDESYSEPVDIDRSDLIQDDGSHICKTKRIPEEERPAESKPRTLRE